jgi:hypothetical protein
MANMKENDDYLFQSVAAHDTMNYRQAHEFDLVMLVCILVPILFGSIVVSFSISSIPVFYRIIR